MKAKICRPATSIWVLVSYIGTLNTFASSLSIHNKTYGVVWIENAHVAGRQLDQRRIVQQVKNVIENQLEIPLKYDSQIPQLKEDQWRLARKVEKINRLSRSLIKIVLGDPTESSSVANLQLVEEKALLERSITRIPKSDYGPEIQDAKVALAAFHWSKKDKSKTRQLLSEAQHSHPEGRILTTIGPELDLGEEFDAIAASETSLNRRKECSLKWAIHEEVEEIWANGFFMSAVPEKIKEGLHTFVLRNKKGEFSEKVIKCRGADLLIESFNWGKTIPGNRLDRYLICHFPGIDHFLIFEANQTQIQSFSYSNKKGIESLGDSYLKWDGSSKMLNMSAIGLWKKSGLENSLRYDFPTGAFKRPEEEKWYNKSWVWALMSGLVVGSVFLNELHQSGEHSFHEGRLVFQSD